MSAFSPPPPDLHFHGLWSLWELMEHFPASLFIKAIGNIDKHYSIFSKAPFFGGWASSKLISAEDQKNFDELYQPFEEICVSLELIASEATLRKMRDLLKRDDSTYQRFFH